MGDKITKIGKAVLAVGVLCGLGSCGACGLSFAATMSGSSLDNSDWNTPVEPDPIMELGAIAFIGFFGLVGFGLLLMATGYITSVMERRQDP